MQSDAFEIEIHSPGADEVWLVVHDGDVPRRVDMVSNGPSWTASVPVGSRYSVHASGADEMFDEALGLVDPMATQVWFPEGHDRHAGRPGWRRASDVPRPLAEAIPWPGADCSACNHASARSCTRHT